MSDRSRVLIVCAAVGRPSETWLWRQIIGFKDLQATVACWAYENREAYPTNGIPVHVLNHAVQRMDGPSRWLLRLRNTSSGNFYGAVGKERRDLCTLIEAEKPDVLLCHFGHYALRLLPVAVSTGVPLVVHFHGLDLSSMLKDRWYRWSLLHELQKFAAVVVVGEHQQKWMQDQGVPADRLHLIPCGAPVAAYNAQRPQPAGSVRFIAVSRLVAWKGVDLTIRAFATAAASIGDCELLIVGEGPERNSLQDLAHALGVGDRVRFAGARPAEQVRAYYETSHIFVQHSISHASGWVEGFGVSIVEAAAAGLPVVVSRSGGIGPQVIDGRTGFLVPERDVPAMAGAMVKLAIDGESRTRMGLEGRRHVETHFDSEKQIAKLERVLLSASDSDGSTTLRARVRA